MREIKFRGWNKILKEMYLDVHLFDSFVEKLSRSSEYEIMQWIGLKDKNGSNIYEGDILIYRIAQNRQEAVIVVQSRLGWAFEFINDGFYGDDPVVRSNWKYLDKCTVFGNIHENSEILKKIN